MTDFKKSTVALRELCWLLNVTKARIGQLVDDGVVEKVGPIAMPFPRCRTLSPSCASPRRLKSIARRATGNFPRASCRDETRSRGARRAIALEVASDPTRRWDRYRFQDRSPRNSDQDRDANCRRQRPRKGAGTDAGGDRRSLARLAGTAPTRRKARS
jgi:hypothetical protein